MKLLHWSLALLCVLPTALCAQQMDLIEKECPAVKTTLAMPKDWFFFETKDPEDGSASYLVTREKVENDYDTFKMGMTLNIIKNVNGQTSMKPSEYARALLDQNQEKDDSVKMETADEPPFKIFKNTQSFDTDDGKMVVLTVLKANDSADTLYHFTWQYPQKEEAQALPIWKEMLKRIKLDPSFK